MGALGPIIYELFIRALGVGIVFSSTILLVTGVLAAPNDFSRLVVVIVFGPLAGASLMLLTGTPGQSTGGAQRAVIAQSRRWRSHHLPLARLQLRKLKVLGLRWHPEQTL
jgi:hypothetical protein